MNVKNVLNKVRVLLLLGALASGPSNSFQVVCFNGLHPYSWNEPTLYSRTSWDSFDLLSMNIVYMNSIAYGPDCAPSCTLLLIDSPFAPMSNFPSQRRDQVLQVFVGGLYTMNTSSRGFQGSEQITPTEFCTVSGGVAPFRGQYWER
jgi:hypothetical protein